MTHSFLQRRAESPAPARIPESVRSVLRQPGQPLPVEVRREMESRFGHDFSRVRIHTDATAERSAKETGAAAWTVGRDIAFGANRYRPQTKEGRRLLAHELTHVIQQRGAVVHSETELAYGDDAAETEALHSEVSWRKTHPISQMAASVARRGNAHFDNGLARLAPAEAGQAQKTLSKIVAATDQKDVVRILKYTDLSVRRTLDKGSAITLDSASSFSLRQYFHIELSDENLVNAYGLLYSPSVHEDYVAMGRALLQPKARDTEVFRILYHRPVSARRELERHFNNAFSGWSRGPFGLDLAKDTLQSHLRRVFSGWEQEKAIALLDRNLTEADEFYFNVAVVPNKGPEALKGLRHSWRSGYEQFEKLHLDWGTLICGTSGWDAAYKPSRPWISDSLSQIIKNRMWKPSATFAEILLAGHEAEKRVVLQNPTPGKSSRSQIRNKIARDLADTAIMERDYAAVLESAQELSEDRGALGLSDTEVETRISSLQTSSRNWLLRTDAETADLAEIRLVSRFGKLRNSDKAWLAEKRSDLPEVVKIFDDAFAAGLSVELRNEAATAVQDKSGNVIRPQYSAPSLLNRTQEPFYSRAWTVMFGGDEKTSQANRGGQRLTFEFKRIDNAWGSKGADASLEEIVKFLGNPHFNAERRAETIEGFLSYNRYWGADTDTNKYVEPIGNFLGGLAPRFGNGRGSRYNRLQDILRPPTRLNEFASRSRAGYKAAQTGFGVSFLNFFTDAYDDLTGENTRAVVLEAIERLEYIAEKSHTAPAELAQILTLSGLNSVDALANLDWQLFQVRLSDYRAVQKECADVLAGAFEVLVEVALTAATGGVGGWAFINTLVTQAANIGAQKLLLGDDVHALGPENIRKVITKLAETGVARIDLRAHIASALHYKDIERLRSLAASGKNEKTVAKMFATVLHNTLATGANQIALQGIGLGINRVFTQQAITYANVLNAAKSAQVSLIGNALLGIPTTFFNPAIPNDFSSLAADRLHNDLAFKTVTKVVDTIGKNFIAWGKDPSFDWEINTIIKSLTTSLARGLASSVVVGTVESAISHRRGADRVAQLNNLAAAKGPGYLRELLYNDQRALQAFETATASARDKWILGKGPKPPTADQWLIAAIREGDSDVRDSAKTYNEDAAKHAGRLASGAHFRTATKQPSNPTFQPLQ